MYKILNFTAKDVRGYMNFNLSFDKQLNFLIGVNGTGKTTVFKLISALLMPSYEELSYIGFKELYLELSKELDNDEQEVIKIRCTKKGRNLTILYSDSKGYIQDMLPIISIKEKYRKVYIDDSFDIQSETDSFSNLKVVEKIRNLRSSLFLGVNRKVKESSEKLLVEEDSFPYYRNYYQQDKSEDMLDSVLQQIENLIHARVREFARAQYSLSEDFKSKIFADSFQIDDECNLHSGGNFKDELLRLPYVRRKLNVSIQELGLHNLSVQFTGFFNKADKILRTLTRYDTIKSYDEDYFNALLTWVIIHSQMKRIDGIIEHANRYKQNIEQLNEPIRRFVESVNLFFNETGKSIEVDSKGDLIISMGNVKSLKTIYELSSGEKQIIVMIAQLALYKKAKYLPIFMIDEPELSLHLAWQELFVDALMKASPNTQFILATHAPAIISTIDRRKYCIDLTTMNS